MPSPGSSGRARTRGSPRRCAARPRPTGRSSPNSSCASGSSRCRSTPTRQPPHRHWRRGTGCPVAAARWPGEAAGSDSLGDHVDGAARALRGADPAALAEVGVELVAIARAELDHGVVRADAEAVVAFEAVAAGKAAPGLEERVLLGEALDN